MNTTHMNTADTAHTSPGTGTPTTAGPALAADDPRAIFARGVRLTAGVIAGVRPEQLTSPTPCDAFDVRALLGHLVAMLERVALMGRGENPFAVTDVVERADDDWADAWLQAAHRVEAAWTDDTTLDRIVTLPWAAAPGSETLASYTSELLAHTWDLAAATGQRPSWDDEVVAFGFASIRAGLPAGNRLAMFEEVRATMPEEMRSGPPPFLEAVEVAADAPLIDQLVAWTGRRP